MKIAKNTAVTLSLKVSDDRGLLIDDGKRPVSYLHGGYDNIFARIEAELEGQERGFQTSVALTVDEAFGERDPALETTMPKAEFPPGVKVGGQIQRPGPDGQPQHYFVTKIKGPVVMLDGNHPLAGRGLRVSLKVLEVREASAEEIAHQHVHGDHGHQH